MISLTFSDAHPSFWEGLGRGVSEGLDWAFDGYNWYNHGARPFMHEKWHTAVGHFNRWRGDEDASRNNFDRASYERAQIWNARRRA
ncbi:unnamed protein product, partial [Mesorhabditis belari]|uniref:Uncharacterized protein n=1 Tax=Mesorhabditis belari TaxID=2138241 RepID=A0AAF3FLY5_9BILA